MKNGQESWKFNLWMNNNLKNVTGKYVLNNGMPFFSEKDLLLGIQNFNNCCTVLVYQCNSVESFNSKVLMFVDYQTFAVLLGRNFVGI